MTRCRLAATAAAIAVAAIGGAACSPGSDEPRTATSSPPAGPTAGQPVACTEIGCHSGVFADLSGLRRSNPSVSRIEICLGSSCGTFTREQFDSANAVNRRLKGEGLRRVTLVGYDDSGDVVLRDSVSAPSVRSQPNGPDCPPVCFSVTVRVDPEGRLVR